MFNLLDATPPVYTTSDSTSCTSQDVLPILTIILLISFILIMFFLSSKKNDKTVNEQDELEKLKEYKKLLDEGIITQEDYEEKKKQVLKL